MGQVTITLNGRTYRLKCGDGEETRLLELARYLSDKISGLASEFGHVGDDRLNVMAALLITDELFDARAAMQPATANVADATKGSERPELPGSSPDPPADAIDAAPEPGLQASERATAKSLAPPAPASQRKTDSPASPSRTTLADRLAAARGDPPGPARRTRGS